MGRSSRGLGVVVVLGVVASLGLVPVGSASAAVPGDVVISEFMFDPLSGVDGDEFLELTNRTASPVDLSGWSFTKGITLVFPAGRLDRGQRPGRDLPGRRPYPGDLRGCRRGGLHRRAVQRRGDVDPGGREPAMIDSVKYTDRDPWPTTTDGTGPSLELIDPAQDHNDPVNWAASTAAARQHRGRGELGGRHRASSRTSPTWRRPRTSPR